MFIVGAEYTLFTRAVGYLQKNAYDFGSFMYYPNRF